jgi:hypothetical protein
MEACYVLLLKLDCFNSRATNINELFHLEFAFLYETVSSL